MVRKKEKAEAAIVAKPTLKQTFAKMKAYRFLYLLLAAAIIWTIVFCYAPLFGLAIAFQDFKLKAGIFGSEFVGLDNFIKVLTTPKFLASIKNTVIYSSCNLFLGVPFPIIFAIMMNEIRQMRFKKVVQTVSYLPHFLSWVSVAGIFYSIFSIDGFYNDFMVKIVGENWERTNIMMNPDNFLGLIFWSLRWKEIGWGSIIYLAAISGIDPTLYEAAVMDGCKKFKQVIYITIPCIAPTIITLFIMSMGSLFQSSFEQIVSFQNIYTQEATETLNTIAYRQGIQGGQYSVTTALGIMQGLVSFSLVFGSNWVAKKLSGTGLW
ncbi:MAG: sugar ABC transporter permease [Clostridia bacterium]|nr:sugar ABC transporter permease [Clostridia bacterium]